MIPGEYFLQDEPITLNDGRGSFRLRVDNTGDRPIQVGSHTHFFEVNRFLKFDRPRTYGCRLDVPAGTALRFEPGEGRQVDLVPLAGTRHVHGMRGLVAGALDERRASALLRAGERGFTGEGQ
jgi:urease beta subunit